MATKKRGARPASVRETSWWETSWCTVGLSEGDFVGAVMSNVAFLARAMQEYINGAPSVAYGWNGRGRELSALACLNGAALMATEDGLTERRFVKLARAVYRSHKQPK